MNKHEVKFANTAKRLQKALLDLLTEKEFIDISITDVCRKANVNRSTFYAHYDNTAELVSELENSLIDTFNNENADLIEAKLAQIEEIHKSNILIDTPVLSAYLEFVKRYRRVFSVYNSRVVFSKSEHERILKELIFIPALKANGINDDVFASYMFTYYLSGINAIVNKWVRGNCAEDTDTVCTVIKACILRP